jgi:hypothetical protein
VADVRVEGADAFLALSRRLKEVDKDLRKSLHKRLRESAKTLTPKTRQAARSQLPSRGGFAALVARTPQRVQVRTGAKTAGVRIVIGKKGSGARAADSGTIRHPVFGDRSRFVSQQVEPGWFSQTAQDNAPEVREDVVKVLRDVAEELARRG